MPSSDKHLENYRKNRNLAHQLFGNRSPSYEWVAIAAFYGALHLVENKLGNNNIHSQDHQTRERAIGTIIELKPIRTHYKALQLSSVQARYECVKFNKSDAEEALSNLNALADELLIDSN